MGKPTSLTVYIKSVSITPGFSFTSLVGVMKVAGLSQLHIFKTKKKKVKYLILVDGSLYNF